jgi:hypothetical protein
MLLLANEDEDAALQAWREQHLSTQQQVVEPIYFTIFVLLFLISGSCFVHMSLFIQGSIGNTSANAEIQESQSERVTRQTPFSVLCIASWINLVAMIFIAIQMTTTTTRT